MTADEMRISDWSSDVCSSDLLARAERSGRMPAHIAVGVMLEVPALLFQMQALLRRIDFLSVGSNDLIQFLFASDRGNARVSNRYDVLSPAVLGFLRSVLEVCAAADIPVNLCGGMAGYPLEAMALRSEEGRVGTEYCR